MNQPDAQASISVAMCTYNGERYLQEQLDSIAVQTRLPAELVVCDDRSSDRTVQILQTFAQKSPFPVRIYENPVQLRSTRNFDKAIRLCQGEYIALSDQDDRWLVEKLELLGAMLDGDPSAGMAFSDASLIDSASCLTGGKLWDSMRFRSRERALFMRDPGRVLLDRPVVTGATVLFRRSLLQHFSEIPENWVHDGWIAWMSVLWGRPLFSAKTLTQYRTHSSQQLGVGKSSFFARMRTIRNSQRFHYASVAAEFEALLKYIRQRPSEKYERWGGDVEKTIGFYRARSNAPSSFGGRFLFLIRHFSQYQNLSGMSWRSLVRDFLMGRMEQR